MGAKVLAGQVAIVTGCGRLQGLGRGVALALADAGADVAVTDIVPEGTRNIAENREAEVKAGWRGLDSLVEEIQGRGQRALALVGDLRRDDDVRRMVAETIKGLGKIDILVNNAAAPHGGDRTWSWEVPQDAWDQVIEINLRGPFLMCSAVIPHLLERQAKGRVIMIASDAGKRGYAKLAAYSASKFGLLGFTQSLAAEVAPHGITVNAICPGLMNTSRQASNRKRVEAGEDLGTGNIVTTPVGRMGEPFDIGHMAVFLANPASDFITGQAYSVNGGFS